ncbi:MAG: glycosyltransferase involved in cell wall biosynthesis [Myxococcota bacterium]|jgi:glycosyltransferase involved in cell wall biosynthesis
MRPLRIVQAAAFPYPTAQGSQVYVRGMSRALARRGHRITVACYGHGDGGRDPGVTVVRTPQLPGYHNLRAGPDLIKPVLDLALAATIARLPADIVHAHNYEAPLSAVLAGLRRPVPMVYTAHNTMGEELHTYFQRPTARLLARRLGGLLDRCVPRLADHAIAINPATAPFLHRMGCPAVSVIPPGVDPDELPLTAPARLPPGPWVVYAGNPDAYQDLDILFDAMRRIPEVGLLLVSASPQRAFAGLGMQRVHFVQTADFAVVRTWLAAASLAVLPRTVCSGFPIKLLNYLGMGLPTVASAGAVGLMPGVVPVPDHDPAAMARAIEALLRHPGRRHALGAEAREHVLTRCTWDGRAAELEAVYSSVLSRERVSGILRPRKTAADAGQR